MAFPELTAYIAEQTQQGIPAETLRQALLESGWREPDIDNAFHDVAAGLEPLTEGASLHEDVSQVRSMVVHLAARMRSLESVLASAGVLPMQAELPAGPDEASRMLPAKPRESLLGLFITVGLVSAAIGWMVMAFLIRHDLTLLEQAVIAASAGAIFLIAGLVAMRFHSLWSSAILISASLVTWGTVVWISWYENNAIEWSIALALGVLLLVLAVILGRRLDRR